MIVAPFKVVLDANVLFPFTLRDTLLRAADAGLVQVYWSQEVLDEMTRNLVGTGTVTPEQAGHLSTKMHDAFPEAMVTGHAPLIPAMRNHEKDCHVAAVAVKVGAQVIVTSNLKDFESAPGRDRGAVARRVPLQPARPGSRRDGRARSRAGCGAAETAPFLRGGTARSGKDGSGVRGGLGR